MRFSKSRLVAGSHYHKRLYLLVHKPERVGEPNETAQAKIDEGMEGVPTTIKTYCLCFYKRQDMVFCYALLRGWLWVHVCPVWHFTNCFSVPKASAWSFRQIYR